MGAQADRVPCGAPNDLGVGRIRKRSVRCACADVRLKENFVVLGPAFNHSVALADSDLPSPTEIGDLYVFQLDVEVFGDGPSTGQDGEILQHRLAAVAETGCPHGAHLQRAAELPHNESGQSLALNILRDDEQRFAAFSDLIE